MYSPSSVKDYYLPHGYIPNDNDIICGRGKANTKHHGNVAFISIIRSNLDQYTTAASRIEKSVVVTSVVDIIVDAGMRFLKIDSNCNQYVVLCSERSHEKVGHAIRDLLKQKKNKNNKKCKNAKRTMCKTTNVLPDTIQSVGNQNNETGMKRPLSSAIVHHQQQQFPESIFSMDNVSGEIAQNSGGIQLVLSGLSDNIFPSKITNPNDDIFAIVTDDIFSMDCFESKKATAGDMFVHHHHQQNKQHNHINNFNMTMNGTTAVCPLPLDSQLDFGCLDIEALRNL